MTFNESTVEQAAMTWLSELGYMTAYGPECAPGEPGAERDSYKDVILYDRLRNAIDRLNQPIPAAARKMLSARSATRSARRCFRITDVSTVCCAMA